MVKAKGKQTQVKGV